MPPEMPIETPRTLAAAVLTIIAAMAMTGVLMSIFTYFGWISGLLALGRIGNPILFFLYGACAIVLTHHLTHHPKGLLNYLTKTVIWLLVFWAMTKGQVNSISLIFGVAVGFAWLHWIHHIGDGPRERKTEELIENTQKNK